ncbi:glucose 1-dehydrogenase [Lactovum odontotermitis]
MKRVQNKVAVVTGAASGMGAETARLLAQEGAKVIATDVNVDALNQVVAEINENGGAAIALKHDVTSAEDWQRVADTVRNDFGPLDILVNNAGISFATPLEQASLEDWHKVMDINCTSIFLSLKAFLPLLRDNNGGSIINISSMAALVGNSGSGPYTASKGAVRSLTKAVAVDYAQFNIRCNSIHPGYIRTAMSEALFENPDMLAWFHANTPLPYLGEAVDIAQAVLFLASDESKFITGIELPIDGGVVAR